MSTEAKITAVERAEAELDQARIQLWLKVNEAQKDLTEEGEALDDLIAKAQAVVMARLKTRAYEVAESYRNSGADETPDLDAWDAAVETADPREYDIRWMQEWAS